MPISHSAIKFLAFASTAGRLRTCSAAAFASFKKYAAHFLNPAFGMTEPKEAAPQVLVKIYRMKSQKSFKYK
jgi:hypothetical protein